MHSHHLQQAARCGAGLMGSSTAGQAQSCQPPHTAVIRQRAGTAPHSSAAHWDAPKALNSDTTWTWQAWLVPASMSSRAHTQRAHEQASVMPLTSSQETLMPRSSSRGYVLLTLVCFRSPASTSATQSSLSGEGTRWRLALCTCRPAIITTFLMPHIVREQLAPCKSEILITSDNKLPRHPPSDVCGGQSERAPWTLVKSRSLQYSDSVNMHDKVG